MSAATVNQPDENHLLETAENFSVVVMYADRATRERAIRVCDHMALELSREFDFDFSWWKFDYLRDAKVAKLGAAAAAQADMIIFSAHADGELPATVTSWIESWVSKRDDRPSALVALIGTMEDPQKGLTPAHFYLRNVAQRAKMDYLPHAMVPLSDAQYGSVESILRRAETTTPFLQEILNHTAPTTHWGINE